MGTSFAQRMIEAWNSGNVEKIGEMYPTDVQVLHPIVPDVLAGRDAVVQFERRTFAAFYEIHWEATRVVADGPNVALEFQVEATNSAPIPSPQGMVPATGKRIILRGVSLFTLNSNREITEERRYFDSGELPRPARVSDREVAGTPGALVHSKAADYPSDAFSNWRESVIRTLQYA